MSGPWGLKSTLHTLSAMSLSHCPPETPALLLGSFCTLNGYFISNPNLVNMEENTEVTGSPVIKNVLAHIPVRARRDSISAAPPPRLLLTRNSSPVAAKKTTLIPMTAVENTRDVGFRVQLKKNAAKAYHSACLSFLRNSSSS